MDEHRRERVTAVVVLALVGLGLLIWLVAT